MGKLVSSVYDEALFELSKESGKLDEVYEDFTYVIESIKENPEFFVILNSPQITQEDKKNILEETYKGISDILLDFFKVLVDRYRIEYLMDLYDGFRILLEKDRGILDAEVISASKLDDSELDILNKKLCEITGKKILIENIVDPKILGGLIIKVEDKVVDGSLVRRLENLRSELHQIVI